MTANMRGVAEFGAAEVEPGDAPPSGCRPTVLTVKEACEELRISRWHLNGLIRSRQLESIKIGRSRRIPMRSIHEYVRRKLVEDFE